MATDIIIPQKERWTYQDYLQIIPPDSFGFEILRGELIVSPSPNRRHQRTVLSLGRILDVHVNTQNLGEIFVAPFDVVLDADSSVSENIVQPDLMFVSKDRLNIITEDNIRGAPDLMVEILSASSIRRDRVDKMKIYAEFGVKEYWIIDTEQKTLEAFVLRGNDLVLTLVARSEVSLGVDDQIDVFESALFPRLKIPLSDLWYPE